MNWYKIAKTFEEFNPKNFRYFPKELLRYLLTNLKKQGFDIHDIPDMMQMLEKKNHDGQNYLEYVEGWQEAFKQAIDSVKKRRGTVNETREKKEQHSEIDWGRLRELGYTNNLSEAGYITPDGKLIDLSGKRKRGDPGVRNFDHRQFGGIEGMRALIKLGYIRMSMSNYSAFLDIAVEPTEKQYNWIYNIANISSNITIDLKKNESLDYNPLTFQTRTSPMVVVNKIKEFYKNKE